MKTGNQFLETERIGKLMRKYAIPCIISLLVGAVINIILDPIFIFCFKLGMMGAEKKLRVKELFTKLLVAESIVGAVALLLAEGLTSAWILLPNCFNRK